MNSTQNLGDADFSEDFRNPGNMIGSAPYEALDIADKYKLILEQRERILDAFLAEHAGLLPSQIRQVTTQLPNGDVAWHVEVIT